MQISDISKIRLSNQKLSKTNFSKPEDIVKYLGASQSQDFMGAKWGLGQRLNDPIDDSIDESFNKGKILRTHALRPTWHFVAAEDIRWLMDLNAPQVKRILNYYNKKLDLNDNLFKKTNETIKKALKDKNFLTRTELSQKLKEAGFGFVGQKLGHVVGWAELESIICSGPKIGKQFTYALVEEVAPNAKTYSREESIKKLILIFFETRGPATLKDFSKWSGLPALDCKTGLDAIKSKLKSETIEGKEYWYKDFNMSDISNAPIAMLLPNYDEYVSSYSDYSVISEKLHQRNLDKRGNAAFWNHIVAGGMIIGSWRRTLSKTVDVELVPYRKLTKLEEEALEQEVEKFGKFLNLKSTMKIS